VPKKLCKVHRSALQRRGKRWFCLACLGATGGSSTSKAKVAAAKKNARKAAKARKKYSRCPRYGSHRPSPVTGKCYGCPYRRPA